MAKIMNGNKQSGMKSKTDNRTLGVRFETELCKLLAQHGWWAHNLSQNQTGQPADVIAVKNDMATLIDCKVCSNDRFPLSRIECNQEGAMTLWKIRGNTQCYFAMKLSGGEIYMVHFDELYERYLNNKGTITRVEFKKYRTFEEWLKLTEDKNAHQNRKQS